MGISISSGHYVSYSRLPQDHLSRMKNNKPKQQTHPNSTRPIPVVTNFTKVIENSTVPMEEDNSCSKVNSNSDISDVKNVSNLASTNSEVPEKQFCGLIKDNVEWIECDDEFITELTDKEFKKLLSPKGLCTPYILFYTRRKSS